MKLSRRRQVDSALGLQRLRMIQNDMTYQLLKKALEGTHRRQEAIATNLANLNTKDYKASRVTFENELKKVVNDMKRGASLEENRTRIHAVQPKTSKDTSSRMNNDGNNVDLDLEMSQMAANQILYQTLIQQMNQKYQMTRYVIHEGRR